MNDNYIGRPLVQIWCEKRYWYKGEWIKTKDLPEGEYGTHLKECWDYFDADREAKALLTNGVDYCWVLITHKTKTGKSVERLSYTN